MKQFQDNILVQTKLGTLSGYQYDNIYRFHGITYATAKRFEPPVPVQPWEGIVEAKNYGYTCPLIDPERPDTDLTTPHRFWPQGEDCLNLNIWTGTLDSSAKKPVMVWIHGGILSFGSSLEMLAYDGTNMTQYGDVVTVTLNHRLNMFGYLDLSSYGERFANSGNAGIEDLICALKWIRDNIAAFGGDPDNITLFGQSGGGIKIVTLLQTPSAAGLFHKAILMSGGAGRPDTDHAPRRDAEIAQDMIEYLGGDSVEILQTAPWEELIRAFKAVAPKHGVFFAGMLFFPVENGWYLGHPLEAGFSEFANKVPLLVGSTMGEFMSRFQYPNPDSVPQDQRRAILAEKFGEDAVDALIAEFKKVFPDKNELTLCGFNNRSGLLDWVKARAESGTAPVYNYVFAYDFPIANGLAWHCADIPYAFHNAEMTPVCNGEGSDQLEQALFGAFMAFAHTGVPSGAGLADWPAYTVQAPATMYFDAKSEVKSYGDETLQQMHEKVAFDIESVMRHKAPNP